jgi:hypothetical protein
MPAFGAPPPQRAASVRVVSARRRSAVALTLRASGWSASDADSICIEVCADSRTLARYAVDRATAVALACLLDGPVWLLIVAADAPGCVFGRLWALVPATEQAPIALADDDRVYALPLTDLRVADDQRAHPGDLIAEVSHLLHNLPPGSSATT